MALKLNDGRYIKLNFDGCYIDSRGVHVSYFQYDEEGKRQKEIAQNEKLQTLLQNVSKYIDENLMKLESKFGKDPKVNSQQELLSLMSDEDKEIYDEIHSLEADIHLILSASEVGDRSLEKELKNLNLLKKLGYSSQLLDRIQLGQVESQISGVFTGQKFTYDSMYRELKKIFKKDRYKDC